MTKKKWVLLTATILLICVLSLLGSPKFCTKMFVELYHDSIENGLETSMCVPADDAVLFGYKHVNTWEGEHSMTELVISVRGDTYYGCYYSPDDVPLAFQNTQVTLTQDGQFFWTWIAEGDNH